MMKKVLLFALSILLIQCKSEENKTVSNEKLPSQKHLEEKVETQNKKLIAHTYDRLDLLVEQATNASQKAKRSALGESYWTDSIPNLLRDAYIENHQFTKIDGSIYDLSKVNKPIFLQFSSAWPHPHKTEITALNKIAGEYADQIDFVLVLVEDLENLKDQVKNYNANIHIVPHPKWPDSNKVSIGEMNISGFTHKLGYPFNYLISAEKQIVHAAIGKVELDNQKFTSKQILDINYQQYKDQIEMLLDQQKQI